MSLHKSIMQIDQERCYECGRYGALDTHHVFRGPFRKKADLDGLTVKLCRSCHDHVHKYPKGDMNMSLRRDGMRKWMRYYGGTEEDFRKRYGRSVL